MERFTNDRTAYWDQIKLELLGIEDFESLSFQYLEMSHLLTHGFSFSQKSGHANELILRTWNAEFDNLRFAKGVYNLDRLAISKAVIELSKLEQKLISNLLTSDIKLLPLKGVILDGLYCQLQIKNEVLDWNSDSEIEPPLLEFINFLRNKTS